MKASELRIGNYHLYKIVDVMDERKEWWESCVIDIHDLVVLDKEECLNYAPIPLTEDWLLKFGFEKINNDVFRIIQNDNFKSLFSIAFDNINNLFKIAFQGYWYHVKHVHQLQNLYFALTGEELSI